MVSNKEYNKKWRTLNRVQYREIDRLYKKEHYVPVLFYKWETESRRLLNIRIF